MPYINGGNGSVDTSGTKVRKLLLEEFTGHTCANCPPGAQTIHTLQNTYPDRIISVAIHAGNFAWPTAPTYTANFQCNEADDYFNFFSIDHNPVGMVNRRDYPLSHMKEVGEWGTLVDSILVKAPDAVLQITNNYNSGSRQLTSTVRCEFLNSLNGTYKLVLLLTEDSIVSPQKDASLPPPNDDLTYTHRHMLRDAISSTSWGDSLATGFIAAGDTFVKIYNYTLPAIFNNTIPDENHCYVVAYIYNAANYEVMQAEEKKIK